ncbi:MAG TPA: hypothetical protein VFP34_10185 [Microlunatus sp.]|nr:hypothetical protein [Microlunatus sp.]
MRSRIAQVGLIIAGLLIALYPFTLGAHPSITCRGVPMAPGQTCAKADGSAMETYEKRVQAARRARPIIVIVGLGVAAFGVALLMGARRRPSAMGDVGADDVEATPGER